MAQDSCPYCGFSNDLKERQCQRCGKFLFFSFQEQFPNPAQQEPPLEELPVESPHLTQKEWVSRSIERMIEDLSEGRLTEEGYFEKIQSLRELEQGVTGGFMQFLDSVREFALENQGEIEDYLAAYLQEAQLSVDSLHHFFNLTFQCMFNLAGGANVHYYEQALSNAGRAMDLAEELDALSERADLFLRDRSTPPH